MIVLALSVLLPATALAQPPVSAFYGRVTAGGRDVTPGTAVSAYIDGVRVATAQAQSYLGHSVYTISIPGSNAWEGKTVAFRLGNVEAQGRGTWQAGISTNLDLASETELPVTGDSTLPLAAAAMAALGASSLLGGLLLRRRAPGRAPP
ncbi:MAG: LPXTG cell wall anchor domain-containing protein [Chloroflexi bacterium]|nr:LPXTG cell wall anchor domain-containing protein [Chloroflexota bacterium]